MYWEIQRVNAYNSFCLDHSNKSLLLNNNPGLTPDYLYLFMWFGHFQWRDPKIKLFRGQKARCNGGIT